MPDLCPDCGGTGEIDSGGTMPWGDPAYITCTTCMTPEQQAEWRDFNYNQEIAMEDEAHESTNQSS